MFYFYDWTFLILIPGLILSAIAQGMVSSAYSKYSRVPTSNGLTGSQAAEDIMRNNGLTGVRIHLISGTMTDNYNPSDKIMSLSNNVANGATVAAVGIAAHETGHALQDAQNYFPVRVRNFIVPICGFASNAAFPLFFIGLIFGRTASFGTMLMDIGILLFCVAFLFYLITLPVEFNASKRAIQALTTENLIAPDEVAGVKRVLRAAALTYVASMLMALLNIVRLVAIRGRNS